MSNEYTNYPLGIVIVIASILTMLILAISNPLYFAIALIAILKLVLIL